MNHPERPDDPELVLGRNDYAHHNTCRCRRCTLSDRYDDATPTVRAIFAMKPPASMPAPTPTTPRRRA